MTFESILAKYPRIAIAGGPRTGKTNVFAVKCRDRFVLHTDDFIGDGQQGDFEEAPKLIMRELGGKNRFLVEGVQVPRCLRRGLKVDAVVWLTTPLEKLDDGQERMTKGVAKVFNEWARLNVVTPVFNL